MLFSDRWVNRMREVNSRRHKLGHNARELVPVAANNKHKVFLNSIDDEILNCSRTETSLRQYDTSSFAVSQVTEWCFTPLNPDSYDSLLWYVMIVSRRGWAFMPSSLSALSSNMNEKLKVRIKFRITKIYQIQRSASKSNSEYPSNIEPKVNYSADSHSKWIR
jgi:hypothetical protein